MIEIKAIETSRYILRKVCKSDRDRIFSILHDADTMRHLNMKAITCIDEVDMLISEYLDGYKRGEKFPFAIIDKVSNVLLGIFLVKTDVFDEDCYEFTVYIDKQYWNKGIFSEVLPQMTKFSFDTIGTENCRGFVMKSNIASSTVLKKCGYSLEKTFYVAGLPEMIECYLLTKKDYLSIHQSKK